MSRSPSTYIGPGSAMPLAPGTASAGTSALVSRQDHVHPLQAVPTLTVTPATPSRALNTVFQPHTTNPVLALYSIQIACTASLTGGQAGQVQLVSDAVNPPTTVRATIANQNTSGLTIGLTVVNNQTAILPYLVPAGHYVKLVSTNTTGTPTYAMVSQTEEVLA